MASRITPSQEEQGAKVEVMVGVGGLVVSVCGRFGQNSASICRTEVALMAPMIVK